jgi:hypothetical protein
MISYFNALIAASRHNINPFFIFAEGSHAINVTIVSGVDDIGRWYVIKHSRLSRL